VRPGRALRANPYDRAIVRLALPALGALAAQPLYVLTDTAVVGHLGTPELGGLAVASTVLITGYTVFIFLAYGTTASVARLVGAGDPAAAAHQGVQGVWLALVIGVVLAVVALPLAPQLVDLVGADGAVRHNAVVYLRISLFGFPPLLAGLAGTGYLRGLQDTRTPLIVTAVSAVANLVIELVLIYGFDRGIGASALATVMAETGAAAVYVRRVASDARGRGVGLAPDPAVMRRLLRVGGALFVRTISLRLSLTLGTAVAARSGTAALASYQIAFEIWSFLALVLDSIAIAGQAMTGRFLGAGDAAGARAAARRMIDWAIGAGVVLGLAVVAARPVLPQLFTDDERVVELCAFVLWFVAALQPVNAVVFVLDGVLIGAGDLRFLARAMVFAAAVFLPAVALVGGLDLGLGWLWAALGLLMLTRLAALMWRFTSPAWEVTGAAVVR
jgi:putative MATE family efflux protein